MKVSMDKIEYLCGRQDTNVSSLLREAGVSRNAFYSLARKESVVPGSLVRIADSLGVSVSDILEESYTPVERVRHRTAETERIKKMHRDVDRDNVRHTLILLDERPVDRLRRALLRGRSFDLR